MSNAFKPARPDSKIRRPSPSKKPSTQVRSDAKPKPKKRLKVEGDEGMRGMPDSPSPEGTSYGGKSSGGASGILSAISY